MGTVMDTDYNGVLGRQDEKVTFGQKIDGSSAVAMEISGRKGFKVKGDVCSDCAGIFKRRTRDFRGEMRETSHSPKHTHPLTFDGE